MVDALVTLVTLFQVNSNDKVQLIRMSIKKEPAHCLHIKKEVDGKPWYHDILQYVKDRQYPNHVSENDKRILKNWQWDSSWMGKYCIKKEKIRSY